MEEEIKKTGPTSSMITIAAIISCILWGTAFKLIKIMNVELGVSKELLGKNYLGQSNILIGLRFIIAGAMTLLYAIIRGEKILKVNKKQMGDIFFMGVFATALAYYFFNIGNMNILSSINSAIVSQSAIFFGVILSHFVYDNDKLNKTKVLSLLIGFLGLIVSQLGDGTNFKEVFNVSLTGEGFMIIYGLIAAVTTIVSKKISGNLSTFIMTGWNLIIGGSLLIIVGSLMGGDIGTIGWTKTGTIVLILLGLNSAIPFCLWYWCAKHAPISKISMYRFTVPVSGSILAILLGEKMTLPLAMGLVLVSISIIMMNKKTKTIKA